MLNDIGKLSPENCVIDVRLPHQRLQLFPQLVGDAARRREALLLSKNFLAEAASPVPQTQTSCRPLQMTAASTCPTSPQRPPQPRQHQSLAFLTISAWEVTGPVLRGQLDSFSALLQEPHRILLVFVSEPHSLDRRNEWKAKQDFPPAKTKQNCRRPLCRLIQERKRSIATAMFRGLSVRGCMGFCEKGVKLIRAKFSIGTRPPPRSAGCGSWQWPPVAGSGSRNAPRSPSIWQTKGCTCPRLRKRGEQNMHSERGPERESNSCPVGNTMFLGK